MNLTWAPCNSRQEFYYKTVCTHARSGDIHCLYSPNYYISLSLNCLCPRKHDASSPCYDLFIIFLKLPKEGNQLFVIGKEEYYYIPVGGPRIEPRTLQLYSRPVRSFKLILSYIYHNRSTQCTISPNLR